MEREKESKRLKRSNPTKSGDTRRVLSQLVRILYYALVKIVIGRLEGDLNNVLSNRKEVMGSKVDLNLTCRA